LNFESKAPISTARRSKAKKSSRKSSSRGKAARPTKDMKSAEQRKRANKSGKPK
jgi:hypothetical protein